MKFETISEGHKRFRFTGKHYRPIMWDGLCFGLIWGVFEFISKVFPYHLMGSFDPTSIQSILYGLAGACSAVVLGYNIHPYRKWSLFIGAVALACGGGYAVGVAAGYLLLFRSMPDYLPYIVLICLEGFPTTLAFIVMGCCFGATMGGMQRDWQQVKRLTLAGGLGFGCYFLITFLYSNVVFPFIPLSLFIEESKGVKVPAPIVVYSVQIVRGILCGIVSGSLLGLGLRRKKEGTGHGDVGESIA